MTCHFHFCFDINFWGCFQNNRGIKTFNHKFCHRPIILWKLAKLHQRLLENGCYPTKSQVLDHYQICIPFFQQTLIITIWSYRQVTDHIDKLLRKFFLYEISSFVKIPEDLSLSLVFPWTTFFEHLFWVMTWIQYIIQKYITETGYGEISRRSLAPFCPVIDLKESTFLFT